MQAAPLKETARPHLTKDQNNSSKKGHLNLMKQWRNLARPRHVLHQDLQQDPQSEEVQEASEVTWYDGVFLQRPQNEFGHQKGNMKKNPLCQRQELRSLSPTSMTRASIQEES